MFGCRCPPGDLNPHDLSHWNLNPARLPIPPGGLVVTLGSGGLPWPWPWPWPWPLALAAGRWPLGRARMGPEALTRHAGQRWGKSGPGYWSGGAVAAPANSRAQPSEGCGLGRPGVAAGPGPGDLLGPTHRFADGGGRLRWPADRPTGDRSGPGPLAPAQPRRTAAAWLGGTLVHGPGPAGPGGAGPGGPNRCGSRGAGGLAGPAPPRGPAQHH